MTLHVSALSMFILPSRVSPLGSRNCIVSVCVWCTAWSWLLSKLCSFEKLFEAFPYHTKNRRQSGDCAQQWEFWLVKLNWRLTFVLGKSQLPQGNGFQWAIPRRTSVTSAIVSWIQRTRRRSVSLEKPCHRFCANTSRSSPGIWKMWRSIACHGHGSLIEVPWFSATCSKGSVVDTPAL